MVGLTHAVVRVVTTFFLLETIGGTAAQASRVPSLSVPLSSRLARTAKHLHLGSKSRGYCLRGVLKSLRNTLDAAEPTAFPGGEGFADSPPQQWGAAAEFLAWARADPMRLASTFNLHASDVETWKEEGRLNLYDRGRCGASRKYGHAEISVGAGLFCGDRCIRKKSVCSPTMSLKMDKDSLRIVTLRLTATRPGESRVRSPEVAATEPSFITSHAQSVEDEGASPFEGHGWNGFLSMLGRTKTGEVFGATSAISR